MYDIMTMKKKTKQTQTLPYRCDRCGFSESGNWFNFVIYCV